MDELQAAASYVQQTEPSLAPVVVQAGLPPLRQHDSYLRELVTAIISQQVSTAAAQTIFLRFLAMYDGEFPDAVTLANTPTEDLRDIGLSGVKARYILDLALSVVDKRLRFDNYKNMTNHQIAKDLTNQRGIGPWTADIFLMFCMGRLNVLVPGDLGIRTGLKRLLQLDILPSPDEVVVIAKDRNWAPYESVFCWYLWRSLEDDLRLYER